MAQTPNLALPYIMPAQAQKHVTHNEAIRSLDALVHLSVIDRVSTSPPELPQDGDRYIIAMDGTGPWEGHDLEIAAFQDQAWAFFMPRPGWRVWIAAENALCVWTGSTWMTLAGAHGGSGAFDTLGINATADELNRLALSASASLFNHEGNGHQIKINKSSPEDTASFLFQTNWSGRAEMGTAGDDHFHVKVSPDGTVWNQAMLIDKTTGAMACPAGFSDPVATRAQLKIVTLSQAAYDLLDPPDEDTLYFIEDAP